jgi:hypothetical protein
MTGGGLVTNGQLVVSGGHGTVALEPVDAALHRVALLVDLLVECRSTAPARTALRAVDLLGPGRSRLAADTVVACRRLDLVGLERWSHEQHGQFSDPADRDRLLDMTGGWPLLVDSVAAACAAGIGTSEALVSLRRGIKGALGEDLLASTGLTDFVLTPSYSALVALGAELLADETDSTFEEVLADAVRPAAMLGAPIAAGAVPRNNDGTLSGRFPKFFGGLGDRSVWVVQVEAAGAVEGFLGTAAGNPLGRIWFS